MVLGKLVHRFEKFIVQDKYYHLSLANEAFQLLIITMNALNGHVAYLNFACLFISFYGRNRVQASWLKMLESELDMLNHFVPYWDKQIEFVKDYHWLDSKFTVAQVREMRYQQRKMALKAERVQRILELHQRELQELENR